MNKRLSFEKITFSCIYGAIAIAVIVLLILKLFGEALFVGFPALVLFPIYLTFYHQYKGTGSDLKAMIFGNTLRFLFVLIGILGPALIWYFVPALKESTSSYLIFVPAVEVLGVYTLVMVHFTRLGGKDGDNKQ